MLIILFLYFIHFLGREIIHSHTCEVLSLLMQSNLRHYIFKPAYSADRIIQTINFILKIINNCPNIIFNYTSIKKNLKIKSIIQCFSTFKPIIYFYLS